MGYQRKLVITLCLISAILLTLVSCTTTPTTTESKSNIVTGKFDPAITVTGVRSAAGIDLAGNTETDNMWIKYYEEQLGIKLVYNWVVDSSAFIEKMNLMITSGDLPDVFNVDDMQLAQLIEAGKLADLKEAYDLCASEYTKSTYTQFGTDAMQQAIVDGKMLSLPYLGEPKQGTFMLYIRSDWMEKVGLTDVKTYEDLVEVARRFKNDDPDGNGVDDTYGFLDYMDLQQIFMIMSSFHAYPEIWIKKADGTIENGSIQPEVRTALEAVSKLYKEGLIDKEFGSNTLAQVFEKIIAGKGGILYRHFPAPLYPFQSARNNDPKLELEFYAIPSADANKVLVSHGLGLFGHWVANKNMEHPEALVKMMNLFLETFYTPATADIQYAYGSNKEGVEVWGYSYVKAIRDYKCPDFRLDFIGVDNGTIKLESLNAERQQYWQRILDYRNGDQTMWGWARIFDKDGSCKITEYYRQNNMFLLDAYTGTPTTTMVDKNAILKKLMMETFTEIIQTGNMALFDSYITQWKALGGDTITAEVNAAIK